MAQSSQFQGKTVLITGGNSGIGFATAERFKAEGAKVYITGKREDALREARSKLGPGAQYLVADAGDTSAMKTALAQVQEEQGGIDVLFLNAGIAKFAPVVDESAVTFDDIMRVNVKGPYFTLQAAIPWLSPGSSVIFTTSGANVKGMAGSSAYAMSKAALRSLVRVAAAELAGAGIRVNSVSPGPIVTPIFGKMGQSPEQQQQTGEYLKSLVPQARFAAPEEVASVVLFLASSAASYITGVDLAVDGGLTQV